MYFVIRLWEEGCNNLHETVKGIRETLKDIRETLRGIRETVKGIRETLNGIRETQRKSRDLVHTMITINWKHKIPDCRIAEHDYRTGKFKIRENGEGDY